MRKYFSGHNTAGLGRRTDQPVPASEYRKHRMTVVEHQTTLGFLAATTSPDIGSAIAVHLATAAEPGPTIAAGADLATTASFVPDRAAPHPPTEDHATGVGMALPRLAGLRQRAAGSRLHLLVAIVEPAICRSGPGRSTYVSSVAGAYNVSPKILGTR